jgi:hypothetical protein
MTADWTVDGKISEAAWGRRVEGLLRFYGWRWFHAPDNKPRKGKSGREHRQRVTPGFPDYVAIRNLDGVGPELLVIELKAEAGRMGPGQEEWLDGFRELADAVSDVADAWTGEIAGPEEARRFNPPRVYVGVYRPSQEAELEELLAGPAGVNVPVGPDAF